MEPLEPDELQRPLLAAVAPYIHRDVLDRQAAREDRPCQQQQVLNAAEGAKLKRLVKLDVLTKVDAGSFTRKQ
ncbi:hypothetical protein [Streptomyces sp. NBC_01244]|uniref:hypothetical protein n=1 Tax=Streptomyces sp. NBC_01244 TaxID=2903797 RepID=UPI002E1466E2|nr:hypothetical protein OG247_42160 [Streptomyces sp. NBC_01244]